MLSNALIGHEAADLRDLCSLAEGGDGFLVFDNRSTGGKVLSCDLEPLLLLIYLVWPMYLFVVPSFFVVTFLFIIGFPKFLWRGVPRG